jgi:uncharacterized protein
MAFERFRLTDRGRTFYGNVELVDCHVLEDDVSPILFIVDRLRVRRIAADTARLIERLVVPSGTLVPAKAMRELRRMRLLVGEEPPTPAAAARPPSHQIATPPVQSISLLVAQECQLRCSYCYGDGGSYGQGGRMSEETGKAAIDWLLAHAGESTEVKIGFFGGEPLLAFPLMRCLVEYARARAAGAGVRVVFGVTTSLSLLTDEMIDFFERERFGIIVSLDGPAEIQDSQRPFRDGRSSYGTVVANLRRLAARNPHLLGRATVVGDTDTAAVRSALRETGIPWPKLVPVAPGLLPDLPRPAEVSQERFAAFLRDEAAELKAHIEARSLGPRLFFASALGRFVEPLATGRRRVFCCGAGREVRAVAADGWVYPCHRFAGFAPARLENVLDAGPRASSAAGYPHPPVVGMPTCRACWARFLCGGGCLFEHQARTGNFQQPDWQACERIRAMAEAAIALYVALPSEDRRYVRRHLVEARRKARGSVA